MLHLNLKVRNLKKIFLCSFCLVLLFGCNRGIPKNKNVSDLESMQYKTTFVDLNDNKVNLIAYRGKKIVINYWATWCAPCIKEMPSMKRAEEILEEYGYTFLLVSDETISKISSFKNEWNFDLGGNASAESLNYDLTITTGSSNIFTQVFDSDNNKWELELAGDSNDFNTTQKDADQILIIDYDGDDGNIDIVQQSGSCPQGTTTCSGVIDMEIDSDDAVITINQKDTND